MSKNKTLDHKGGVMAIVGAIGILANSAGQYYETVSGVNLNSVSAICLATPLDNATMQAYVSALKTT